MVNNEPITEHRSERKAPAFLTYNKNNAGYEVSEEESSFPGMRLFYCWANDILWRGWKMDRAKESMTQEDLLLLPKDEEAITAYQKFKPAWDLELQRIQELRSTDPNAAPALFTVLLKTYKKEILLSALGRVIADGCNFAAPFLLRELVNWLAKVAVDPESVDKWEGYVWAIAIAVNQFLMSYANNLCLFYNSKAFCQMKSSIAIAIFDKAGHLEVDHGMTGVAVQLHTTDATKFVEMAFFFHQMWSSPFLIVGALIALYYFVGWAGVLSLACIIVFIPVQGVSTAKVTGMRREVADWADKRLAAMGELLFGIRIVKFMGWEQPLANRIANIRKNELRIYKHMYFWRSVMTVLISFQPAAVSFAVFAIAYAFDDPIEPKNVFPTMAMLNVLRMPMIMLPLSIAKMVDLRVSLDRIGKFLAAPEKESYLKKQALGDDAFQLRDVTCQYIEDGKTRDIVAGLNASIPKNKLTIVVGSTGSGKSTLISAMLGESRVSASSTVIQDGSVAFVPQEAWLMNATVRDNILMGKPYDEARYIKTVKACQLMADLKQLKASDMTEIGERGINVSGGQKQRVAFARAVYSNSDIVVMDDPLSAVDSHVTSALFEHCIRGVLEGKTRVLVTHHVQFLPQADNIIVMGDRCIEFAGTYDELMSSGIDLSSKLQSQGHGSGNQSPSNKDVAELNLDDIDAAVKNTGDVEEIKRQNTNDEFNKIPTPKEDHLMSTETSKTGDVDYASLAWYFTSQGLFMVFLSIFGFATWRACSVVSDMMVSWWSTHSDIAGYTNISDENYLLWYGIFMALQFIGLAFRQIPFNIGSWRAAKNIHEAMITRILRAPTSYYDTTPAGRVMARFSKDIEMIDLVIPEGLNFCYNMIFVVLGAFALVCYASQWLIILIGAILIIYIGVWRYYSATNRAQKRIDSINRSPLASIITQTLSGLSTIRAYNCLQLFDVMHTTAVNAASRSTCSWRATQRWLLLRVDILSCLVVVVVAVVACAVVTDGNSVAKRLELLAVLSLAVTYSIAISGAMGFLVTIAADMESSMNSAERCYEYAFEVPQERDIEYGPNQPPPPKGWPAHGAVTFKEVCLRYADDKPLVLKDISLDIHPGEKVGIVGRTGSGKSTLMLALFRMVEIASGAICFDGINLNDVTMADVRQGLTIIPQDPMLFQGTIRSNLDPFDNATDEQVWLVLEKVGMSKRVREGVDEGANALEATVTEKGNNFSVGQRQLLCLARALLKKCKILLLDEATASVDFESDAMIQRTIRTEFTHCTVLTIAHRLATIIDSDKVLLMDHGVAAEYGTPAALLSNVKSQFHSMVSALGPDQFNALLELANTNEAKPEPVFTETQEGASSAPM